MQDRADVSAPWTASALVCERLATKHASESRELTTAEREELLAKLRAGQHVKLLVDLTAYVQSQKPNRNFIRFRPAIRKKLARSFEGQPFLRDHEQQDLLARGGTIVASRLEDREDGFAILQTVELGAPWAVEHALLGLMDRFSIGWRRTGDVVCSLDGCSFLDWSKRCGHYPGDVVDVGGVERVCEAIFNEAEGVEVSAVSVPAVVEAEIEGIRAALAAAAPRKGHSMNEKIRQLLGLAEDLSEDECLAAMAALKADAHTSQTLLDGERAAHAQTKARLDETEGRAREAAKVEFDRGVTALIERARAEGRFAPTRNAAGEIVDGPIEDAIRLMAGESLEKAAKWVERMPPNPALAAPMQSNKPAPARPEADGAPLLTEAQREFNRQMGISDEDHKKYAPRAAGGR